MGGGGRGLGPWSGPDPSPCPSCPQCSEACGGGQQQRLVTCPEPGLCEEALRPNSTRLCNTQPCTQWVVGPWGQVSWQPCSEGHGEFPWSLRTAVVGHAPAGGGTEEQA